MIDQQGRSLGVIVVGTAANFLQEKVIVGIIIYMAKSSDSVRLLPDPGRMYIMNGDEGSADSCTRSTASLGQKRQAGRVSIQPMGGHACAAEAVRRSAIHGPKSLSRTFQLIALFGS